MIQKCPACQVLIDRPAKYCRYCGNRLPFDSNPLESGHPGRPSQRPRQVTAPPPSPTLRNPGSTSPRFESPASRTDQTGNQNRRASRQRPHNGTGRTIIRLILGLFILGLVLTIIVFSLIKSPPPNANRPEPTTGEKRAPVPEQKRLPKAPLKPTGSQVNRKLMEAIDSFKDTKGSLPTREMLTYFGQLIYPRANVEFSFTRGRNRMLILNSTVTYSEIENYYRKVFGSAPIQLENEQKEIVFMSVGEMTTFVSIRHDPSRHQLFKLLIIEAFLSDDQADARQ